MAGTPDCDKCGIQMELGGPKNKAGDGRGYHCKSCFMRKSVRHESFMLQVSASFQEFVRIAFFYFLKNYDSELAHRELTENAYDGVGVGSGMT